MDAMRAPDIDDQGSGSCDIGNGVLEHFGVSGRIDIYADINGH